MDVVLLYYPGQPPSPRLRQAGGEGVIKMMKLYKKALAYWSRHPLHNTLVHVLTGMGLGMLLTYPLAAEHPVRWGAAFLVLGLLGHLWAVK